jgi:hypothetical protein
MSQSHKNLLFFYDTVFYFLNIIHQYQKILVSESFLMVDRHVAGLLASGKLLLNS